MVPPLEFLLDAEGAPGQAIPPPVAAAVEAAPVGQAMVPEEDCGTEVDCVC